MPSSSRETDASVAELETAVSAFLTRNFPQIALHGGAAAIEGIDPDSGTVWLRLDGACSGCGISPVTTQAIQTRLVREIPSITRVHVDTGEDTGSTATAPPDLSDVPF